jgi:hypothetical protein
MSAPISVPYINVRQENEFWCWAAVASNVYNSMFPQTPLSQCEVVDAVGQDCNLPNEFGLADALNGNPSGPGLHIFESKSTAGAGFFDFILNELSGIPDGNREPVSAEVDFATIIHFVAITGIDPTAGLVWVADPFPGGDPVEFAFDAFLNRYYFMDTGCQVQATNGVVQALHAVNAGSRSGLPMPPKFDSTPLPDDVKEIAPEGLLNFSSFNSAPANLRKMLRESAEGRGQAWQVFTLCPADVIGKGLEGAQPGGWRIAARSGEEVIAADIYTGNTVRRGHSNTIEAGPPQLACIRRGEEILKMLNTIQQLSQPPLSNKIPKQPFYLHLLLLPGLVTDALWLQPKEPDGNVSYVVPFNTLIKTFDQERVCTGTRFFQIVRPIAEHWRRYREQEGRSPSKSEY